MDFHITSGRGCVIFTDLDGTLLEKDDPDFVSTAKLLQPCRDASIPVVFVSSKTEAEILDIRRKVQNFDPFSAENGGAIFLPSEPWPCPEGARAHGEYWAIISDVTYDEICTHLGEIGEKTGIKIKGFHEMSDGEISELTGLSREQIGYARQRLCDEPFIIDGDENSIERVRREIQSCGLRYSRGGIFHHITGRFDKGNAVVVIKKIYRARFRKMKFAAVGDAANDLPMLKHVDFPFIVRKADGGYCKDTFFKGVTITDGVGPEGFKEAVGEILKLCSRT